MDWGEALERLKNDRGNWTRIGEELDISGNQIRRYVHGNTKSPRVVHAEKIIRYYQERERAAQ